ncbi:MAG: energy-coupling factor transporter transmembrane component T [Peptococcaceae bacterium]|nr:energy-coupling factor transporter transmembrane component T [Peptococcaceae bacterium]
MKAAHLLSDIYAPTAKAKQLYLDPRTKIVLCLVVSFIMLESTTSLVVNALQIALAALPLIFLLMLGKHKMAVYYLCAYVFASLVPQLLVPLLPDIINLLFTGMIALMTQILPGMMMAYFLIVSTSVSEFVTAMDRMHVPKSISVPMSVLFRFFPTIVEEYGHVRDAMRMREVGNLRQPMAMLEYRMVPFMTSIVSIGNDLAASALTRGLSAPVRRTNVCPIGFTWRDGLAFVLTGGCIAIFLIYR